MNPLVNQDHLHAGKLSVLIPVYNEEKTAAEIITRVLALGEVVKEIIIVDDGSTDRTAEILRVRVQNEPKCHFHAMPGHGLLFGPPGDGEIEAVLGILVEQVRESLQFIGAVAERNDLLVVGD